MSFAAKQHAGSVCDDEKIAEPPLRSNSTFFPSLYN